MLKNQLVPKVLPQGMGKGNGNGWEGNGMGMLNTGGSYSSGEAERRPGLFGGA